MISTLALEAVTPLELSKASSLFGTLKQLRIKLKNVDDGILDRAFEIHVQGVLEKLEARLPTLVDSQMKDVEIIMAKHGLYDAAFQQVIILCSSISPALGDSLKDLRAIHSGFMTDLQQSACDFVSESRRLEEEICRGRDVIAELEGDIDKLREISATLDNEAETQQKKVLELRHYLREAAQEINQLRDTNAAVKSTANTTPFQFNSTATPIYGGGANTTSSPAPQRSLQKSSSNVSVISNSTGLPPNSTANSPHYSNKLKRNDPVPKSVFNFDAVLQREEEDDYSTGNGNSNNFNATGNSGTSVASTTNRSTNGGSTNAHRNLGGSLGGGGLNTPSRGGLSIVAPVNWLHIFRVDVQKAIDDGRCREITLKECKDTMERIYESKAVANEKALQGVGNLPMETLEQHAYRSMEKKYGLRNLAVEHVGMLLRALERYSEEDNEVSVFQRIFRNEVEEDFRLIQAELSKSIRELTMVQLMGKYPTKDQAALHTLLEARMGSGLINEDEWRDMVNYLYNPTDSTVVCALLKRLAVEILDANDDGSSVYSATDSQGYTHNNLSSSMGGMSFNNSGGLTPHAAASFVIGTTGTQSNLGVENGGILGYNKQSQRDVKRLGYSSPTLKIRMRNATAAGQNKTKKELLKMPFPAFVKTVLDFQLRAHQQYLSTFLTIFRQLDRDVDGVLNASEFRQCYLQLRAATQTEQQALHKTNEHEVNNSFLSLIKLLDPLETDRIVFSSAVTCLNKLYAK